MKKDQTKEVAVIDIENYPMLLDPSEANNVIEAVQENFDGETVTQRELFTTMPNMKGENQWNGVETEEGKESFKELKGVILYVGATRARFEGEYGKGSKIPLCTSSDGITGHGDPGGACTECEFSQFGANGERPECEQKKPMYVLIPEISPTLPVVFNVPATNFGALKKYKALLSRYGNRLYDVETRFTLSSETTQNKMDTSVLQMEIASNIRKTDPETHKKIVEFRNVLLPYMMPESVRVPEEVVA